VSDSGAVSNKPSFQRPLVMGVLNVTPDSFSDGGEYDSLPSALDHARLLLIGGADIIDVGGESTRPGAPRVAPEVELSRVLPVIDALVLELAATNRRDVRISIDTMNATTALAAVSAGAQIINDVSGGLADPKMFTVAAATGAELVISHWRGFSNGMDQLNTYLDLAAEVATELKLRIDAAVSAGVARNKIILDPGLGFAKDMAQNWELVARLDELDKLGLPILVGASRKRFIAGALDADLDVADSESGRISNSRRDLATAVLTALLLQRKLWGVRVHNVVATNDAIAIVEALRFAEDGKAGQS
jgi:dihydropteroate synthase